MKTTCCHCGVTDEGPLVDWIRDAEGFWWHRQCRKEFLERVEDQLKRMKKEREK